MDLQLKGKIALVTGSTGGIGLAIGARLAGEGARVIITGRSENRVADAIASIRQKNPQAQLEAYTGDLSRAETAERIAGRFPQIDILINNLGLYEPKPFEARSDHDWRAIIQTNFMSFSQLFGRVHCSGASH